MITHTHRLIANSPGDHKEITSFHFGAADSGRKIYMQAGLHADELPGMLVLHHLRARLLELEAAQRLCGEIVLVPVANPIGLAQTVAHDLLGRFELASGRNFNRDYPDFFALLNADSELRLGSDEASNRHAIRAAIRRQIEALPAIDALDSMRRILLGLAHDADVVLDLHCDFDALLHLYTEESYLPQAEPLARHLGAHAVLHAMGSGCISFDECLSGLWWQLRKQHGATHPIPLGCFAATVELRGEADVSHALAHNDATALLAYLGHLGVISGMPATLPAALCTATPLGGVDPLHAPTGGIFTYCKQLGDTVTAGEIVLELIDPISGVITPLASRVDGVFFSRENRRFATPGTSLGKIAGHTVIRHGRLLGE